MTTPLPEPAYRRLSDLQSGIENWYSADQMHQHVKEHGAAEYKRGTADLQAVIAERDDLTKLLHQALDERDHYVKERDGLQDRCKHSEAWEPDAKRLALELECLIMSRDMPAASKWWDSAHEAMELHRQLIADIYKDAEEKS